MYVEVKQPILRTERKQICLKIKSVIKKIIQIRMKMLKHRQCNGKKWHMLLTGDVTALERKEKSNYFS